ncbi:hypothetical protein DSLASN_06010 [Desulfoluna limicola]|uniref:Flagellar Assembly Protein A N-terminal region domain-containing protein n=1 Tax=Desulfoluna limicola TaxID=2810562 RepID=A0ABN6EX98_9BACT|nr:flagellar assembly protein A [Desulfoluna limicola]BCS94969.1 hypothetical protein DSLASN_06010 [Desulfoluna limicola]
MINATCPNCKHVHSVPASLAGTDTVCIQCGDSFTIMKKSARSEHSPLARIVLEKGLVTKSELSYALKVQSMAQLLGKTHSLDSILYRLGFISMHTLHHLFAATVRFLDREFGDIAVKKGMITPKSLEKALAIQAEEFTKARLLQVGTILVDQGDLAEKDHKLLMFGYQERAEFYDTSQYPTRHDDPESPDQQPHLLGMIAREEQLVDSALLETILKEMDREDSHEKTRLDTILLERKLISPEKLKDLVAETERVLDRKFIAIALKKNLVSEDQVHHAMEVQEKERKKARVRLVSDILLEKGVLSLDQCNEIFRYQKRAPKEVSDNLPPPKTRRLKRHLYKQLKNGVEFGKLAVKNGYISDAQLLEALKTLKDALNEGRKTSIEEILVIKKLIRPDIISMLRMVKSVTEMGEKDNEFGEIAIHMGRVKEEEVKAAFEQQIQEFSSTRQIRSISEILVLKNQITAQDVEKVRARMTGDEEPSYPTAEVSDLSTAHVPEPPKPDIHIADDGLSAWIVIPEEMGGNIEYSDVLALAAGAGIAYGLVDEPGFTALLKQPENDTGTFVIAEGIPPIPGQDATIHYHFKTDYLNAGRVSEDGRIDFKTRGDIPFVEAGSLLAELVPPVPETPGIDVRGEPIEATAPEPLDLAAGTGTSLSPDGLSVHADSDGSPHAGIDGIISVFQEYRVEGDVGLRTGHITFHGNVVITGTIREGFRVKGAHVTATSAKGADIVASAGVLITEGIIDSRISAGGSIQARYISNSKVDSFGDVVVMGEIMDSRIRASGLCMNRSGDIISSEIVARKGLLARNVGTDVSRPCLLKVGVDEHSNAVLTALAEKRSRARKRFARAVEAQKRKEEELVALQGRAAALVSRQESLMREEAELSKFPIKSRDEYILQRDGIRRQLGVLEGKVKGCFDKDDALSEEIALLKQKIVPLREALDMCRIRHQAMTSWARSQENIPVVSSSGTLTEGTVIIGPNAKRVLSKNMHRAKLKEHALGNGTYIFE